MSIQAGFAAVDITPAVGTRKIGWLKEIVGDTVLSPLFARVAVFQNAVFQNAGQCLAFVQLDTLFIAWPEVAAIRQAIAERYGFPGERVMIAATHNHAGPAVIHAGDVPQDEAYAAVLVEKVVKVFGEALDAIQEAEIGFGHTYEWSVAHNRRVVMRDGTVRTHGTFDDPDAVYLEGPIDPEVAVVGVRAKADEQWLGTLVNFACHPTHHGGDTAFDAGYPGVLARAMAAWGCPMTLFLNGASGNLHTSDPRQGGRNLSAAEAGERLAQDVQRVLAAMTFENDIALAAAAQTLDLPYRKPDEDEIRGRIRGAQRFIDPAIYDRRIPALIAKIQTRGGVHRAEIQVLALGPYAFVAVPGEIFVEYGLQIKTQSHPAHALVVSCANGRVGYIPSQAAFARGGYETTFGPSSMLAPEAGTMITKAAVDMIVTLCDRH
jgi:hypothetical protein